MRQFFSDAKHGLLLAGGLLLSSAAFECQAVEDQIHRSFDAGPKGKLVMDVDRGSIHISTTPGRKLSVEVLRSVTWTRQAQAERIFKAHQVEMNQHGDTVTIRARSKDVFWFNRPNRLQVRYAITAPEEFDFELKTAGGSIDVADAGGAVRARTSGGSLRFRNVAGPLWGRTSGGSIVVEKCGSNADVETSGGSLKISEVEGNLTGRTAGGSIQVRNIAGDARVQTSGGSIRISDVGGRIEANTSGGSVSARLSVQPEGDCNFRTSGGGIEVQLAQALAVNLDATTSGGWVTADLPGIMPVASRTRTLRKQVNGGGPELILRTQGGNVRVKTF
jgi:hypothetical protein